MRWGLGPVFLYECLANSRRWQTYAIRSVGAAVLLAAIATIAMSNRAYYVPGQAWRQYAELGESYFYAIVGVVLTLVMLAAPAATAGAICVDRARGTLTHMLATDLSDPEIVLGKLAARLLPILGLVACTWPVLAICSLLGGIDPTALTLAFAIILAVALLGCTMALALSVWARKPHEVVLVVYTFWVLVLLLYPLWYVLSWGGIVGPPAAWSLVADPYYLAFAPYNAPGRLDLWDYLGFFAAALGASAALAILAVWRMRPVARRGTDDSRRTPGLGPIGRIWRRLPGPSLDGNPVLWREWHRSRPSRWVTILVVLLGGSTGIACVVGAVSAWANGLHNASVDSAVVAGFCGMVLQLILGLLMLSAVAPMSMSEERQRGSLDLLAATTLSTPTIVLGKWLGTLRPVLILAIGPGLMGVALATAFKHPPPPPVPPAAPVYAEELSRGQFVYGAGLLVATILVHGAMIASVGLALATWIRRQARAIALSVGFAVMVGAGWPIFVAVSRLFGPGQGPMCLSPAVAAGEVAGILANRLRYPVDAFWWTTFWDVECLVLALGLLWLTVRTFDVCFGRIAERPRRTPVLSDIVVVLAALLGTGGLFGAIVMWIKGFRNFILLEALGGFTAVLAVVVGLLLLSALAPLSVAQGAMSRLDRRSVLGRWWQSFRLVLLLAIGPALFALGLATAHVSPFVMPRLVKLPGGGTAEIQTFATGDTYVTTIDASGTRTMREATEAEIAAAEKEPPTWTRAGLLGIAALSGFTILAHGAAIVSLGLALGIGIRRRGRAIGVSVGLALFMTVCWPIIGIVIGRLIDFQGLVLASLMPAFVLLLLELHHWDPSVQIIEWAAYWDMILILMAVIVAGLAIRSVDRRSQAYPPDGTVNEEAVADESPMEFNAIGT